MKDYAEQLLDECAERLGEHFDLLILASRKEEGREQIYSRIRGNGLAARTMAADWSDWQKSDDQAKRIRIELNGE